LHPQTRYFAGAKRVKPPTLSPGDRVSIETSAFGRELEAITSAGAEKALLKQRPEARIGSGV